LASHYKPGVDEDIFVRELRKHRHSSYAPLPRLPIAASSAEELLERFVDHHYFSVDAIWREWLHDPSRTIGNFERKPHAFIEGDGEALTMIFKRGGTVKVVAATLGGTPSTSILRQCACDARTARQRKLSVIWPLALVRDGDTLSSEFFVDADVPAGRPNLQAVRIYSKFL
jgi:hypothetical protein